MNRLEINDSNGFEDFWPISTFKEAYPEKETSSAILSLTKDDKFGDETVVLILRSFIEKGHKIKKGQKYILALRFYNFGDLATLDLISLDKEFHAEIALEHFRRLDALPLEEGSSNDYDKTLQAPFIISGGRVKIDFEGKLKFFDNSFDYGGKLLFGGNSSICDYIAETNKYKVQNSKADDTFLRKILNFMLANKTSKEFYEKLISLTVEESHKMKKQQIMGLVNMKVLDRYVKEGKDILQLYTEEMTSGFSREVMLRAVAENVKKEKMKNEKT